MGAETSGQGYPCSSAPAERIVFLRIVSNPAPTRRVESRSSFDRVLLAAALVLVCGALFRVLALDADPAYPFWAGYITDEGRWTELAREWVLFGAPDFDTALTRTHLILAPVFQVLAAGSFSLFGVSAVSARLISVAAGFGVLVVAAVLLRSRLTRRAWLGTVALLAIQPDLVYFSRVAIPEMTALFFETLAFALLVAGPRTTRRAFLGGLATALALGVKGTTAPIVLVFVAVIWAVHSPGDPGRRRSRIGAFLAAIVIPAVVFGGVVAIATGSSGRLLAGAGGLGDILPFARLDSAYGMVATLIEGGWTVHVNLVLVALWIVAVVLSVRNVAPSEARAVFIGAAVWVVGWIVPWAALEYFPERYVVHIHAPLVLALGAGVSLLNGTHGAGRRAGLDEVPGWRRAAFAWLLAAPLAAALTPALVSFIDLIGSGPENLRYRLALMLVTSAAMGLWLARRPRPMAWWVATLAPLAIAALWLLASSLGVAEVRFWAVTAPRDALVWGALLAGVAVLVVVGSRRGEQGDRVLVRGLAAYGMVLAAVWLFEGGRQLTERTYVIKGIAAELTSTYPPDALIGTRDAASVFLDTPFRYREIDEGDPTVPVALLVSGDFPRGRRFDSLIRQYDLVGDYRMEMGRGYDPSIAPGREVVRVYRRRQP